MSNVRNNTLFERLAGSPWFWTAWVVVIAAFPIIRAMRATVPDPLPIYKQLPEFTFLDQYGEIYGNQAIAPDDQTGRQSLRNKVWVANFIFTRCTTVCPIFTKEMFEIQTRTKQLIDAFHMVSFTVDPEYDSPEVLLAYAKKNRVSPRMWSFLTGDLEQIKSTVVEGFHIHMAAGDGATGDHSSLMHGSHFVLVDYQSRIRGYYKSDEKGVVDRLLRDVNILLNVTGDKLPDNVTLKPAPFGTPKSIVTVPTVEEEPEVPVGSDEPPLQEVE